MNSKKQGLLYMLLFACFFASAQIQCKTILSKATLALGESFRVQYVAEGTGQTKNYSTPLFENFRVVNTPEVYNKKNVYNIVYTLQAIRTGRLLLPGININIDGNACKAKDEWVQVTDQETASSQKFSDRIDSNFFVKVEVNKTSAYIGEPVLVTFKLYSCLQSTSEVIKHPVFYGFSTVEMPIEAEKKSTTEHIQGKAYTVHHIRQLQLFPLRMGNHQIDAMEIKSTIDLLSNSRKQQISKIISTKPITIHVHSIPVKNKPITFNGAVGRFEIKAEVKEKEISKNEVGHFQIIISGRGNLMELTAPTLQWPASLESFEPSVNDSLHPKQVPLAGQRIFEYPFVATQAGTYKLPIATLSFFDKDSNNFKSISSNSISVLVTNEEKASILFEKKKPNIAQINKRVSLIAVSILALLALSVLCYWIIKKKDPAPATQAVNFIERSATPITIDEVLAPVANALQTGYDFVFYQEVQQSIWRFLNSRINLTSVEKTKNSLVQKMKEENYAATTIQEISDILAHCELKLFAMQNETEDKPALLMRLKACFEQLN